MVGRCPPAASPARLAASLAVLLLAASLGLSSGARGAVPAHATATDIELSGPLPTTGIVPVDAARHGLADDLFIGPGAQLAIQKVRAPASAAAAGTSPKVSDVASKNGCTANWVWKDQTGALYLGAAGHCFVADTPAGSPVPNASGVRTWICHAPCPLGGESGVLTSAPGLGWVELGPVVYARASGIGDDFGIVAIPPELYGNVGPSLPNWGGPSGVWDGSMADDVAVLHGNGGGVGETAATKDRVGVFPGAYRADADWFGMDIASYEGDSGSAVGWVQHDRFAAGDLGDVRAVGLLTHLMCPPLDVGSVNGISLNGIVPNPAGCREPLLEGTTVHRAIAMAKEAGLCLGILLEHDDPLDVAPSPDCFAAPPAPAPPPCDKDNRDGNKCCTPDDTADPDGADGCPWLPASLEGAAVPPASLPGDRDGWALGTSPFAPLPPGIPPAPSA